MVISAKWKGVEVFGQHLAEHDPINPESAAGVAEEFLSDYDLQRDQGSCRIKIGVGMVNPIEERVVEAGRFEWTLEFDALNDGFSAVSAVSLRWESPKLDGLSCVLEKRISILDDGDGFVIERRLINTGSVTLSGMHYGHNFIQINNTPVGPGYLLLLPGDLPLKRFIGAGSLLLARGRLRFSRELSEEDMVTFSVDAVSMRSSVSIVSQGNGIMIDVIDDRPASRFGFYATRRVICPELFTRYEVEPGNVFLWKTTWCFRERME
jgi:hypothetical protein